MAFKYVPYVGAVVTHADAKRDGTTRFFTGVECKRGHLSQRLVSNMRCMACFYLMRPLLVRSDKAILQKAKNDRDWRIANRDKVLTYKRDYYARHAKRLIQEREAKRQADPEKQRSNVRNYRARKRSTTGRHTAIDIADILKSQRGKCAYCRVRFGKKYHADHIKALATGGTNDRRNIQLTCGPCNKRKSAIDPIVYAQRIGLLL